MRVIEAPRCLLDVIVELPSSTPLAQAVVFLESASLRLTVTMTSGEPYQMNIWGSRVEAMEMTEVGKWKSSVGYLMIPGEEITANLEYHGAVFHADQHPPVVVITYRERLL